ncbi:transposase [Nostoc sp.]|uniref:transposase n=1 Tax=Nostoc sp. TaxID=1180 RepID=UPI002FFA55AA
MSRKAYSTDVSDVEWDLIKSMIPVQRKRKREVDMRKVVNAIFYINTFAKIRAYKNFGKNGKMTHI